jgi:hypothetical protein
MVPFPTCERHRSGVVNRLAPETRPGIAGGFSMIFRALGWR